MKLNEARWPFKYGAMSETTFQITQQINEVLSKTDSLCSLQETVSIDE